MKVYENVSSLIGNTPLVRLSGYQKEKGLKANILGKLEYFNPAGSIKDRIALYMLADAREKGLLNENSVIIEPTSGNTGIGLAAVAAEMGYRTIITMPDTMSIERRNILKAYGAEVVLTEGAKGMKGAIAKANELAEQIPHSFIPGQFTNAVNPLAHYKTTGPEIWQDTDGEVDFLVAGVGTGGTLTGVGEYLKEKNRRLTFVNLHFFQPFLNPALFLNVGSSIFLRILKFLGVTSKSSSTSIKSNACSRESTFGGTRVRASSAEEERVLVKCFFLHTFNSMSSGLEEEPITIPE